MTEPTDRPGGRGGQNTVDTPLSPRELAFVAEYLVHFSAKRAAEAVGYVGTGIKVTACRLLGEPHIQAAIQREMAERIARLGVTADRVLKDIDSAANLDIADLFDEDGRLLPVRRMPAHVRRAIVSVEVVRRNLIAGDGVTEHVHKVKIIDKGKMHEILAKYAGLVNGEGSPDAIRVPAFILPADTVGVSVH